MWSSCRAGPDTRLAEDARTAVCKKQEGKRKVSCVSRGAQFWRGPHRWSSCRAGPDTRPAEEARTAVCKRVQEGEMKAMRRDRNQSFEM